MKSLLICVILFTAQTIFAYPIKEAGIEYKVGKSKLDKKLKINQAVYHFKFNDVPEANEKPTIRYSIDLVEHSVVLDASNSFSVKTTPGKHSFEILFSSAYAELFIDTLAIKGRNRLEIALFLTKPKGNSNMQVKKPVIYLYPAVKTEVHVEVAPKGAMTFTYPAYKNGWNVTAEPSGKIHYNDETLNYLFWESEQAPIESNEKNKYGEVISGKEATSFLNDKLSQYGLTSEEKADFITFWGPSLATDEKWFVRLIVNEECNQFADLKITPKPDHIYRIYLLASKFKEEDLNNVKPIKLAPIKRSGFTVIEWGGSILGE